LIRVAVLFLFAINFVGCQTPPKKTENTTPAEPRQSSIDLEGLKKHLGLSRPSSELGFNEKSFDTCLKGFSLPQTSDCTQNYFVVINFRLQCRHTTGTISQTVTAEDVEPIANAQVKWSLRNLSGKAPTDQNGYGQLEVISPISQRAQRLRLAVGTEFLYIRAGDISRVVTPGTWCD
jgi:hypothetical protein